VAASLTLYHSSACFLSPITAQHVMNSVLYGKTPCV